jgi:hypothetical protein
MYHSLGTFPLTICQGLIVLLGFTHCDEEKGTAIDISYSDARSLVTFSGVSYCDIRERVFMFDYETKEKEHQNTW